MRIFAMALLLVTAAASADEITIHFPDTFIIATDCPQFEYMTWVENQRHFGKIDVNPTCEILEGVQRPGAFPTLPANDMNVTLALYDELYFNCAVINTWVSAGESKLVVQCLEVDLIFRSRFQ